jgi:hypothetical protein
MSLMKSIGSSYHSCGPWKVVTGTRPAWWYPLLPEDRGWFSEGPSPRSCLLVGSCWVSTRVQRRRVQDDRLWAPAGWSRDEHCLLDGRYLVAPSAALRIARALPSPMVCLDPTIVTVAHRPSMSVSLLVNSWIHRGMPLSASETPF